MRINLDKPDRWKKDVAASVDMYNRWFMEFAPKAFRETRLNTTKDVEQTLQITRNLADIGPQTLRRHPQILPTLRMSTCPPIAVDRLIGLAGVPSSLVKSMEGKLRVPPKTSLAELNASLQKIADVIQQMADPDIFVWINRSTPPTEVELHRAATIVADRLCGSVANPIIRNAQEKRQLATIQAWLEARGYQPVPTGEGTRFDDMPSGSFSFRMNIPVTIAKTGHAVNIPVDAVIKPKDAKQGDLPIFLEAKSAGDFTNTNKRRKEEAVKMAQLQSTYGKNVRFCLFLCGYFDSGYLGYEAAEGIDWVWEHRLDELAELGL